MGKLSNVLGRLIDGAVVVITIVITAPLTLIYLILMSRSNIGREREVKRKMF